MLKKLLKYDLKAINKYFLPMSIFFLIYSIIGTLVFQLDHIGSYNNLHNFVVVLVIAAFVIMSIVYSVIAQGIVIVNFFKSMATDTGYLTHTLPVKKRTLIISKTIASMITLIICGIVMLLSLTIFLDLPQNFSALYPDIADYVNQIIDIVGTGVTIMTVITFLLLLAASLLQSISMFFVSIAFGQLINRHKVIGSFVSYFVLTFLLQIISTIMPLFMNSPDVAINTLEDLNMLNTGIVPLFLGGCALFQTLLAIIFLFITNWIFTKKLNLD